MSKGIVFLLLVSVLWEEIASTPSQQEEEESKQRKRGILPTDAWLGLPNSLSYGHGHPWSEDHSPWKPILKPSYIDNHNGGGWNYGGADGLTSYGKGSYHITTTKHDHHHVVKVPVYITKHVVVEKPVPVPEPVIIEKPYHVPIPIEKIIHKPIPIPVPVPQAIPVPVEHAVPFPVKHPVPVPVQQPYPVPVKQAVPVPVPIAFPIPSFPHHHHYGRPITAGFYPPIYPQHFGHGFIPYSHGYENHGYPFYHDHHSHYHQNEHNHEYKKKRSQNYEDSNSLNDSDNRQ